MGYFPGESYAAAVYDFDAGAYPLRPQAKVVRWVGPSAPPDMGADDEWQEFGEPPIPAGGWTPAEIDGVAQWGAADLDLSALADGAAVTSWTPSWGNIINQATASLQPSYRTNVVNGLPVVRFAGDDYLDVGPLGQFTEWTLVAVCKPDVATGVQILLGEDASGYSDDVMFGIDPDVGFTTDERWAVMMHPAAHGIRYSMTDSTPPDTANFEVVAARYDGAIAEMFRNDPATPVASVAGTFLYAANRNWILGGHTGRSAYFDGDVAEFAMFSTGLSDHRLEGLFTYLLDKYAIA